VVWTDGGLDKLKLYAKPGIPKLWMWPKGRIEIHRLEGDARRARLPRRPRLT
jgi:hypothetical protein